MELTHEQIILGLVVLVIAILLLNRNNEGFGECRSERPYETGCYYTGDDDGKAVGDYCKSINGDWSRDGCPKIGGRMRRRCKCIYWHEKANAEYKARQINGY